MRSLKIIGLVVITSVLSLSAWIGAGSVLLALMILALGALGVGEIVTFGPVGDKSCSRKRVLILLRALFGLLVLIYAISEFYRLAS